MDKLELTFIVDVSLRVLHSLDELVHLVIVQLLSCTANSSMVNHHTGAIELTAANKIGCRERISLPEVNYGWK